jgi:hypothetical protein
MPFSSIMVMKLCLVVWVYQGQTHLSEDVVAPTVGID